MQVGSHWFTRSYFKRTLSSSQKSFLLNIADEKTNSVPRRVPGRLDTGSLVCAGTNVRPE